MKHLVRRRDSPLFLKQQFNISRKKRPPRKEGPIIYDQTNNVFPDGSGEIHPYTALNSSLISPEPNVALRLHNKTKSTPFL